MDNFDLKKYLAEGRIHEDSQELNEKKQDSKKGNKEEQKRMEGAIRDNRDHIKSLEKDIKADQKKLKKLKADEPKDVNEMKKQGYDDREDESLGARKGAEKGKKVSMKGRRDDSYGKFDKRDAEAKGKAKGPGKNKINKEEIEVTEDRAASAARGLENIVNFVLKHADKGKDWIEKNIKMGSMKDAMTEEEVEEGYGKPMYDEDDTKPMKEDEATDEEEKGYQDGFKDAKKDMKDALSKMKISELKAKIREDILATLAEADEVTEAEEDVDVDIEDEVEADVDVDVKDTVDVDAEGDEIDIVKPAVKAKVEVGLSPEEEIVQDSLKAAMDAADAIGNDKLADQIGNTITFFTREYVVGRNTD